ncbi:MAG: ROK family transcriptional regulator [Microterricola sp.]
MASRNAQGTPGWLGAVNDRTALTLLLDHGVLTRNRIGELSGLSKPTAAQIVSRLEEAGLIYEATQISGGRGPNAAAYAVHTDRAIGVAGDKTPTALHPTVAHLSGAEHPVVTLPVARSGGERSALGDIRSAIDAACAAAGSQPSAVRTVLIGVQGAIDPRTDELSFAESLPGWPRRGLRAHLEDGLHCSVAIDNDANLAAIAERTRGAGVDSPGFALLWMGNGLGVSIDQNGALLRGAAGGAGEIGYLPVPVTALAIDPAANDLQDLMGGPAVSRLLRTHGVQGRTLGDRLGRLDTATPAVRSAVFAALAPRIAHGALPVLAVLDPGTIVLGGPIGAAGGSQLAELVRSHIRRSSRWSPDVVATTVGAHPVLRGAHDALVADVRTSLLDDITAPSI